MGDNIQRRGMNASGLTDVLEQAGAPKGVLYYHFPGGKSELTVAAITASVDQLADSLQRALSEGHDPLKSLERWLVRSAENLSSTDFMRGCPLATVALESTADDIGIRAALASGFQRMREIIAEHLSAAGHGSADAARIAFAIVAAYEGGLLQARVSGDVLPMIDSCQYLLRIVRVTA